MYRLSEDKEAVAKINEVIASTVRQVANEHFRQCCPICSYTFEHCQCRFGGSAHPDRSKRKQVVLDHLYLLSKEQLDHVIKLQEYWQTSYGDEERTTILKQLKGEN